MKKNILSRIVCLALVAFFSLSAYAQEKIFLIKDSKVVATYGIDEVDYLTFEDPGFVETDDFEIKIDELDYRYAIWTVTPKDPDMYYYSAIYTKEALADRFQNSVELIAEALYSDMGFLAGMVGVSVEDFMKSNVLYKGEAQIGNDQLGAGSEYVILAFGINPDGTATTDTYTELPFETPAMDMVDLTVDFAVEGDSNDVTIVATPSDKSIRYYMTVKEAGEKEVDLQGDINSAIWRGGVMDKSPEQVIEEITYEGDVRLFQSLEPEMEYVVYACSVTPDGVVNSDASSKTFVTGKVKMSDNVISLTVNDVATLVCNFTITPSNSDSYSVGLLPASAFEGMTDQEVLERYVAENRFSVDYNMSSGERTISWNGLSPDTEYVAFAFGFYHGVITTQMFKVSFKTLPSSDPKTWTATFGDVVVDIDNEVAVVQIDVNQDDVWYLWNVVDASGTPEQIHEALLKECERYEGMGINYVEMRSIVGLNEVTFSPYGEDVTGKKYKFFAVVMNAETYEFETEVFFSDVFTMDGSDPAAAPAKAPAKAPLKLLVDKKVEK